MNPNKELIDRLQLDMYYGILQHTAKEFNKPKSPIVQMVDKATGFDLEIQKTLIKDLSFCLKKIISIKKRLGEDSTKDKAFLTDLKNYDNSGSQR